MRTLNESFMQAGYLKATEGMESVVPTTLTPGLRIHRFGNTIHPERYFTGPWWIGFSPFEALRQYSAARGVSLALVARQCLAIDRGFSERLDVLVTAVLRQALSAWSGTPKTQIIKLSPSQGRVSLRPDRRVTQLCIPGLDQKDPSDPNSGIWKSAFDKPTWLHIVGDA
jgi:hypothetical protein